MVYYFFEFSDLSRDPIKFNGVDEFEKFCLDNGIYMKISTKIFGSPLTSNTIVCTCLKNTNILISENYNPVYDKSLSKPLKQKIDSLNVNIKCGGNDTYEFIKDIINCNEREVKTYLYEESITAQFFIVSIKNKTYEVWVEKNNNDRYNDNNYLFSINKITKLKENNTNFKKVFLNIKI